MLVLVAGILELLPDPTLWRLTLTGDIVTTVNRLAQRTEDNPHTTDRGAGHVGAITLPHDDGSSDILIAASVLFNARKDVGAEELAAHALFTAGHLGRHEAGQAALRLRGEHAVACQDVDGLTATDAACREPLAAHVDDNRIEQYTAVHGLLPLKNVDHLADTRPSAAGTPTSAASRMHGFARSASFTASRMTIGGSCSRRRTATRSRPAARPAPALTAQAGSTPMFPA